MSASVRMLMPGEAAYRAYTKAMGLDPQNSWLALAPEVQRAWREAEQRAWREAEKAAVPSVSIELYRVQHQDDMTKTAIGDELFPPNTALGRRVGMER